MKKLSGTTFIRNGNTYDYCYIETIKCLQSLCDEVIVLDAGSDDGTIESIIEIADEKTKIIQLTKEEWDNQHGAQKLAYFTNKAFDHVTGDWNIYLQCDEIIHEDSFPWIRQAIEDNDKESFLMERINLWAHLDFQLDVPQERKPCSDVVLRLAKRGYKSYGDAESIECYPTCADFIPFIKIVHYGYVRKRAVMPAKIDMMQRQVFQLAESDPKLKGMDVFNPFAWFSKDDLKPIKFKHPKFITKWVDERRKEYQGLW